MLSIIACNEFNPVTASISEFLNLKTVPYIVENEQESSDVARLLSEAMGMTDLEFHPREHE